MPDNECGDGTGTIGMIEHNIISYSGGKDSTAMLMLAVERDTENLSCVFADTGNEHQQTYEYVDYVSNWLVGKGFSPIRMVKADFTSRIAGKREYVLTKWAGKWGATQEDIDRSVAALVPTNIPFLDLCILKGRFPSSKRAFCSEELKRNPIIDQVQRPALETGDVISWQGVRRDESIRRRFLLERELKITLENGNEMWNYRPILDWTADDCFAMHRKHGIKHNPLYEQGMGRVGCMPCINARKDELLEISKRFPEVIDRIAGWEKAVSLASKRQASTFFPSELDSSATTDDHTAAGNIVQKIRWAATSRGGRQRDFLREMDDGPICSSIYGLCE